MTDKEEKAVRYDKRQQGHELKRRVATIGEQLKRYAVEWRKLGDLLPDYERFIFLAHNDSILVLNEKPDKSLRPVSIPGIRPGQPILNELASVNTSWFDSVALIQLLKELEEAKEELAGIREFCRKIGDPLD